MTTASSLSGERRRVLVTGASGLLGSHLLPLLKTDSDVFALRRGHGDEVDGVSWITADLSRPFDRQSLPDRIDAVIYLAQSAHFREFPERADDMLQVNTLQPLALLDYARSAGASNFVYASTGGVYGNGAEPLVETAPPAGNLGFYPASKLAAEILVTPFSAFLSIAVLRYFFIYGAGQKREMLLPRLVDNVRTGRPITVQGEGLRINPVHASDAARATAAAARLGESATVNVAGPDVRSLREIGELIGGMVGIRAKFEQDERPATGDLIADIGRMRQLLGAPTIGLEQGIRDLL